MVEFQRSVNAVLEESEVDTDVEHACALPLQVGVGILRGSECAPAFAIVVKETGCTVCGIGGIGIEAHGIAADTIART